MRFEKQTTFDAATCLQDVRIVGRALGILSLRWLHSGSGPDLANLFARIPLYISAMLTLRTHIFFFGTMGSQGKVSVIVSGSYSFLACFEL